MCASLWEAWTSAATGGREARTYWPTNSDCGALRRPSCCEQPFCSPPRDPYHDALSFCFHGRHKNFGASVPARSICNLRYLLVPLHTSPVVQSIQDNPCIHSRATKKKKNTPLVQIGSLDPIVRLYRSEYSGNCLDNL
jgi:hypothetical protein